MPGSRPVKTTLWAVTSDGSRGERESALAGMPYSTCDVDGMPVVQVMVALERVMLLAARSVVSGGAAAAGVVVMMGVRLVPPRAFGVASGVCSGRGEPVKPRVGVFVGERVGVGEKSGPAVDIGPWVGGRVAVAAGRAVCVAVASGATGAFENGVAVASSAGVAVGKDCEAIGAGTTPGDGVIVSVPVGVVVTVRVVVTGCA